MYTLTVLPISPMYTFPQNQDILFAKWRPSIFRISQDLTDFPWGFEWFGYCVCSKSYQSDMFLLQYYMGGLYRNLLFNSSCGYCMPKFLALILYLLIVLISFLLSVVKFVSNEFYLQVYSLSEIFNLYTQVSVLLLPDFVLDDGVIQL